MNSEPTGTFNQQGPIVHSREDKEAVEATRAYLLTVQPRIYNTTEPCAGCGSRVPRTPISRIAASCYICGTLERRAFVLRADQQRRARSRNPVLNALSPHKPINAGA